MTANEEAAREWFDSGDSDLRSAETLLELSPPETEQAAFHCQQAAEKQLKSLLALNKQNIPRVHDLTVLVELAEEFDENVSQLHDAANILTPYAVAARYPFTHINPTKTDGEQALEAARQIRRAISSKIEL